MLQNTHVIKLRYLAMLHLGISDKFAPVSINRFVAEKYLQNIFGEGASFRPGQWEAIDAIVNGHGKLLLVQRTGWGKSLVYFLSTRILRDICNKGPALIISPLLSLMRDQVKAAERMGVRAETINSANKKRHREIRQAILSGEIDALLISPEQLSNEDFINDILRPLARNIGLFVVDEAHCISDWGHDFRPDYRRIRSILRLLPSDTPVLATTATANDRVVRDIREQLGNLKVMRGMLFRESLALQTLRMPSQTVRLAWLARYVPKLPGSGIIYVLTRKDAQMVAAWLVSRGINAKAYYSGVRAPDFSQSNEYREHLEDLLIHNEVKVLVATKALGMGFDKPDLGFVIHYQAPDSLGTYYQQMGRAGRAIRKAYGILMTGKEDRNIHEYFWQNSFPSEEGIQHLLKLLEQYDGLELKDIQRHLNMRQKKIQHMLKFLATEKPAPIMKDGTLWRRTPTLYFMDHERIWRLHAQRQAEWQEVQDYIDSKDCLMAHLIRKLGDTSVERCGQCASCRREPLLGKRLLPSLFIEATRFLMRSDVTFEPRKRIPQNAFQHYDFHDSIPEELQAEEGRILSRWGDTGWGKMVAEDKERGYFRDALVDALARMIRERWNPDPAPAWVTCVPSLQHPHLVPDFARRLADRLNLPFIEAIDKVRANEQQKYQQNSFHQCRNLDGVFRVRGRLPDKPVLLVDDIIDSGWTMTVLAALLRKAGSGPVYPVALATAAVEG